LSSIHKPRNIDIVYPSDFKPDSFSSIIELPATIVWNKNNFIYVYPKPGMNLNKKLAIEQTKIVSNVFFKEGQSYAIICDVRKASQLDQETRDYYSSPEASKNLFAFVFIVDSIFSQLIANIFINMKTTPVPVRMFNGVDKANNWLNDLQK